jgi:type IV pilus assembly protein PilN
VAPRLAGEQALAADTHGAAAPTVAPGGVVFEILSGYNPLPERRVKDVSLSEDATGSDGAAVEGSRNRTAKSGVRHHGASQGTTGGTLKGGAR